MTQHIVLFCFHDEVTEQQLVVVRAALLGMTTILGGILRVEWGCNDSLQGNTAGTSRAVWMTFRDEESRLGYLLNPEYDAFKALFCPQLRDVLVMDCTTVSLHSVEVC